MVKGLKGICIVILGLYSFSVTAQDSSFQYVEEEKIERSRRRVILAEKQFRRAELLAGKGDYSAAITLYTSAIEYDYRYVEAYYGRAVAYEQTNQLRKAILDYELALQIDAEFTEARFNRGIAQYKLENYSSAVVDFSTLLYAEKSETRAIFFKDENLSENPSESKVGGVSTLYSMRPTFFNYRGLAYLSLAQYDSAFSDFTEAIALKPQNADFWANRAMVHIARGETTEAKHNFEKALQFDPYHSQAKYNLSVMQGSDSDLQLYHEAVNTENRMPAAYFNRGYAYFKEGDYKTAIADYDTTILLQADYVQAYINRGNAKSKLKRYQAAIVDFNTAQSLKPNEAGIYTGRGNAYFKMKQFEKAIAEYTRALTLQANQPTVYYNRGLAYFNVGKRGKACDDLALAVTLGVNAAKRPIAKYCK